MRLRANGLVVDVGGTCDRQVAWFGELTALNYIITLSSQIHEESTNF
jgi:hypothetical protein